MLTGNELSPGARWAWRRPVRPRLRLAAHRPHRRAGAGAPRVDPPLAAYFDAGTVAELVALVRGAPPVAEAHRDLDRAVTAGQQRLWFLAQVDPDALDYHIPLAFRLRGPLDPPTLVGRARRRRRPPRACCVPGSRSSTATPVQEVLDDWRLTVDVDVSGPDRRPRAAGLGRRCSNTPFDLAAAPPMRAALLRLGPDDHVLVLVIHHILVDDWSLGLLCDELSEAYAARLDGRPAKLPALPMQYADHARAEASPRRRMRLGATARSLAYWRERLAGAPVLDLPTDWPRPARRGTAGAFDGYRARRLERPRRPAQPGRAGRTTPFMTLLAAYLALLGLYTGQHDICVGTPVSGRDRTDLEPLIGFFLDTVVLRGDLSGDPTFRDLLAPGEGHRPGGVQPPRRACRGAHRPRCDVRRDPARTPLFDTMLIVHGRRRGAGLRAARESPPSTSTPATAR